MPKKSPRRSALNVPSALTHTVLETWEQRDLDKMESRIASGLAAFFDVAFALMEIKQRRLYRGEFSSFEEYCRKRWDIGRAYAYRLIGAAEVCKSLSPIGEIRLPENECQVRPLAGLPPRVIQRAWKLALETAGNGSPTGATVIRAVRTVRSRENSHSPRKESWQNLVLPLLRSAIKAADAGHREDVEDYLNRALVRIGVGRSLSMQVIHAESC